MEPSIYMNRWNNPVYKGKKIGDTRNKTRIKCLLICHVVYGYKQGNQCEKSKPEKMGIWKR